MIQPGAYPQPTSYQLPPQQQFIVGTYPYHPPTLYPVITTSVDPWSTTGFESYSTYPTPSMILFDLQENIFFFFPQLDYIPT
ncbi:unnamed protein product, partial [Adineta steineri]